MKKDILVYTYNLDIGGIERSLIGLLNAIDYDKYNVDLYMFKHEGAFIKDIPKNVHILQQEDVTNFAGIPIIEVFKKKNFTMGIGRLYAKFRYLIKEKILRQSVTGEYMSQITYPLFCNKMKKLDKHYDMALSFYWPHYFVINNVYADIKLGWIHTDYNQIYPDKKKEIKMWNEVDYIVAVSEECKNSFLNIYPQFEKKTIVVENILSEIHVRKMANEFNVADEIDFNSNIICSVGRFSEQKNFSNIPKVCRYTIDNGYDIKWYIVGYGPEEDKIRQAIKDEYVEDSVIILGKKENPYPYMKSCDIYVQPSKFEGKAVTVREAQILCKPVVITNYATAGSQVINGKDGIIVDMDNKSIADGICSLLENKGMRKSLMKYCESNSFSNDGEFNKLECILNGISSSKEI